MAAVPVTISGVLYDKTARTQQAVLISGTASITGLTIGGGPIIPPDEIGDIPKPPGDWEIWPSPGPLPHPEHPIVLPPDLPPVNPPNPVPPVHEGWNWSVVKSGWYYVYVPGPGAPGPKRK